MYVSLYQNLSVQSFHSRFDIQNNRILHSHYLFLPQRQAPICRRDGVKSIPIRAALYRNQGVGVCAPTILFAPHLYSDDFKTYSAK